MIKTILKYSLLTSTILLVGQIQVGRDVIGRHFQKKVFNMVDKAFGEIKKSKIYSDIFSEEYQEVKNVDAPPVKKISVVEAVKEQKPKDKIVKKEEEEVTQADKEYLMRLLK